jgi:hypothetical protein
MKENMQEWILDEVIKSDDIGFINGCGIDYRLDDPALLGPTDSGWCDVPTGARMPTITMRVIFDVTSERDVLILKTKFTDAIKPYTTILDPLPKS